MAYIAAYVLKPSLLLSNIMIWNECKASQQKMNENYIPFMIS